MTTLIFVTNQLPIVMRRDVFQAIADPVRRDIIELLAKAPLSVNEVANKFDISRPAISKHLKILNECNIVDFTKKGRERYCMIQPQQLLPAFMWMQQYKRLWENRLDNFENYLYELQTKNEKNEK